jgi:hypothetical protein
MEAPKRPNYPYLIMRDTCPSREKLEVFRFSLSDGCPATATLLSIDASLAIPTRVLRFEASRRQRPWRSDRPLGQLDRPRTAPPRRFNQPGWPHLLVESSASVLWLSRVTQWFYDEPLQTPGTQCSLRQSPLMTGLPRSPSSTLVLRLN